LQMSILFQTNNISATLFHLMMSIKHTKNV
jgi:hypothetical protein